MANGTISDQVYKKLSASIISGEIPPGQRLEEKVIAEQYGVSRTPVREAFRQLTMNGLVESQPHKGVTVINLDTDQLSDMFEALEELEAICARMSAERMTVVERKQIEQIHEKSRALMEANQVAEYSELNEQFHAIIHRGARNATLSGSVDKLRQRLAPYRQPWLFRRRDRLEASFSEHEELTQAILAADKERAFNAMHNHVANTSLITIQHLSGMMDE